MATGGVATADKQIRVVRKENNMLIQRVTGRVFQRFTFGTLFLALAASAFGDNGNLPVGSGVCSQQVQAKGIYISGGVAPIPTQAT